MSAARRCSRRSAREGHADGARIARRRATPAGALGRRVSGALPRDRWLCDLLVLLQAFVGGGTDPRLQPRLPPPAAGNSTPPRLRFRDIPQPTPQPK